MIPKFGSKQTVSVLLLVLLSIAASVTVLSLAHDSYVKTQIIITSLLWSVSLAYFYGKNQTALALNSFVIYWFYIIAEKLSYGAIPLKTLILYFIIAIGVSLVFLLAYQEAGKKTKKMTSSIVISASLILYSLPIVHIVYYLSFQNVITPDVRYAIAQTNIGEAIEFIDSFIETKWILFALFILLLSSYFLYQREIREAKPVKPLWALLLILISLSPAYFNSDDFRVIADWKREIKKYTVELSKFKNMQQKISSGQIKFLAEKEGKGELYIVIIGESLNKNHMQLYGYGRDTTPFLNRLFANKEIIRFNNAYSIHTHTMPVLSLALTQANLQNNKPYEESLSIIDIIQKAGFETHWITNQVLYGPNDNFVTIIAKNTGSIIALNRNVGRTSKTDLLDEAILKYVQDILNNNTNKSRALFVHLIGNHTNYCSRFPDRYKKYEGDLDIEIFGALARTNKYQSNINCYDNSVLYNDYVVSSIINMVKRRGGVSGVVYFSDHADDVFQRRGHNSGNFTFSMTQIPFLFWFSEEYKSKFQKKIIHLTRNVEKLFPNDFIYDSLIGMLDIKTQNYNVAYDISSSMYGSSDIKHMILHGKQPYLDRDNIYYWQRRNITALKNIYQENRVIPHRINSVGKLKNILFDGFHALETDLVFKKDAGGYFEVGHGEKSLSGMSFDKVLSIPPHDALSKIWLDIKNINKGNIKLVLNRLLYLDKKYKMKGRVIIESGITDSSFSIISEAGFHTSYYLPTSLILELLHDADEDALNKMALDISEQITGQQVEAISFDVKLYPFVKFHIEKYIKSSLLYHVWDLSTPVSHQNFISELKNKEVFKDSRVKTILVPYASLFNL